MYRRMIFLALLGAAVPAVATAQAPPSMRNSADTIPTGWTGLVFALSKDFPTVAPPATDPKPWKAIDFKTHPKEYIQALWTYCREGNEAVDWAGQSNAVRKWYHAPGLAPSGANGREFIHGLTRERSSRPGELAPTQTQSWSNWAVGLYNPAAAFTIGQVWANPAAPNANGVLFPDGAVAVKLLFTTAPVTQVPNLTGTKEWQGNVSNAASQPRQPRMLRLLQVDLAVRDDRANATTGWVFGTYMYENAATGATPYDKLVPVGLMWGNDPDLTPAKVAMGEKPKESWINPDSHSPHVGWNGRLNGPVDNPNSSCLSCHGRGATPFASGDLVPPGMPSAAWMPFFVNVKAGEPYKPGVKSMDYSLQLAMGIRNFPGTGGFESDVAATAVNAINPRSGEAEPEFHPDQDKSEPATPAPAPSPAPALAATDNTLWIVVGVIAVAVILALLYFSRGKS